MFARHSKHQTRRHSRREKSQLSTPNSNCRLRHRRGLQGRCTTGRLDHTPICQVYARRPWAGAASASSQTQTHSVDKCREAVRRQCRWERRLHPRRPLQCICTSTIVMMDTYPSALMTPSTPKQSHPAHPRHTSHNVADLLTRDCSQRWSSGTHGHRQASQGNLMS